LKRDFDLEKIAVHARGLSVAGFAPKLLTLQRFSVLVFVCKIREWLH